MFERQMKNQENICNRYNIGFHVYCIWVPANEGRDEHLHQERNQARAQGTLNSIRDPPADSNPPVWEKQVAMYQPRRNRNFSPVTSERQRPVSRPLSHCSCPSAIPPSCWHATPLSGPVRAGMQLTDVWPIDAVSWWSKRCCLHEVGLEGANEGAAPALRWLRGASCQVSWGDPGVPFVTSFYHPVILTRSLPTLFHSGLSERHLVLRV